jgi:hypothetical protein
MIENNKHEDKQKHKFDKYSHRVSQNNEQWNRTRHSVSHQKYFVYHSNQISDNKFKINS